MGKSFEELAEHLAALSALRELIGGNSGSDGMKMAQLVAWIVHHKFNGELHLTPKEVKQMEAMNKIAIVGIGNSKDGLTFKSKMMDKDEDDDDDTCECGRCKNCGDKHS